MKKKKLLAACLISAIYCVFSSPTFGQADTSKKKIDSLYIAILDAHRQFEVLSNKIKYKATTAKEAKLASKSDSIFRARRSVINSLANNYEFLPDSQKQIAVDNFKSYLLGAENLKKVSAKKQTQFNAVAGYAKTMMNANSYVSKNLSYEEGGGGTSLRVMPNNYLDMDIGFGQGLNPKDYCVFIFPKLWRHLDEFFAKCYADDQWVDVGNCYNKFDRYAYKWSFGMAKRLRNLYSGKFIVLVLDKAKSKIVHSQDLVLPIEGNLFVYKVN